MPGYRVHERLALTAALLASLVCALPPIHVPVSFRSLDSDWFYLLHAAVASDLAFGRDLHFTYGPLGFLVVPQFHPDTWRWMIGIWAGLALAAGAVWWSHFRAFQMRPWLRAVLVFLVMAVGASQPLRDAWVFALALVMVLEAFLGVETRPPWQQPVSAVVLGILALTKFTFFVCGAFAVVAVTAGELARRRRAGLPLLLFAGTVIVIWALVAGNPIGIVEHVAASLEISSGYVTAMGHARESADRGAGDLLGYAAAAAVLIFAGGRKTPAYREFHAAALAFVFFAVWKAAFVRHDLPHAMIAAEFLMLAVFAVGAAIRAETGRMPGRALAFAAAASFLLAISGFGSRASELADPTLLVRIPAMNARIVGQVLLDPEEVTRSWARWNEKVRENADLSSVRGTFDIYPWGQSIGYAWDLDLAPRPVPHSYSAYTEWLAEENAAHLRGDTAPDWLAFGIETIDGRWPAGDDARSWSEIVSHYDVAGRTGERVLLRRKPRPMPVDLQPFATFDLTPGEPVGLTRWGDQPLWVSFELSPTVAGSVASLLLRLPSVTMRVGLADEEGSREFRIVPGTAASGFLLSPFVEDAEGFETLLAGSPAGRRLLWIELDTGRPEGLWEWPVRMTLSRVTFAPSS